MALVRCGGGQGARGYPFLGYMPLVRCGGGLKKPRAPRAALAPCGPRACRLARADFHWTAAPLASGPPDAVYIAAAGPPAACAALWYFQPWARRTITATESAEPASAPAVQKAVRARARMRSHMLERPHTR